MHRYLLALVFWLVGSHAAGTTTIDDQIIPIRDDLSQGLINTMIQCSDGFFWIGTKDGLNRYDGFEVVVFSPDPDENYSISDHHINKVFEDSRGLLWIGHLNQGLDIYSKNTGRFYQVFTGDDYRDVDFSSTSVYSIEEDEGGNILVGTGDGLIFLDVRESLGSDLPDIDVKNTDFTFQKIWSGGEIVSTIKTGETLYWGTESGLYYLDSDSGEPVSMSEKVNDGLKDERESILNIFFDSEEVMWLVRPHLVTRVESETVDHFLLPVTLDDPQAGFAVLDDNHFLVSGYGLYSMTFGDDSSMHMDTLTTFDEFMARTLLIDFSGMIWLGTNGYGVRKYSPFKRDFNHLLNGHSMRSVVSLDEDNLLVIADLNLHQLNLNTGDLLTYDKISDDFSDVRAVFKCSSGFFWFHRTRDYYPSSLVRWDPDADAIREFAYEQSSEPLSPIWEDARGRIVLTNLEGELMFFLPGEEHFESVDLKGAIGIPGQHFKISSMVQTAEDVYWIGSTHGLVKMKMDAKDFEIEELTHFVNQAGDSNSLGTNHIYSLYLDERDDNLLWIGTRGNGLNRYDRKGDQFKRITTDEGLPNNVVYVILPHERKLWLSTNHGLSVYDRDEGSFSNFSIEEGLQDNEFNAYSYALSSTGELIFGGVNGINYFDPDKIRKNTRPPNVEITYVEINDFHDKISTYSESGQQELQLSHYQNILRFRFSALDFVAPSKNIFKYRLVGASPDWVKAGPQREVSFANLPPGNYRFEVLGTNNSGVWSEKPAVFNFQIAKPWWGTHLAWAAYILIILSGLYALYRIKVNRLILQNRLDMNRMEASRLREIDRVKSEFFSNITHDFKTPLTLIKGPVRDVINHTNDKVVKEKLKLVERSSNNLESLISQLFGLSKADRGLLKENVSLGDIRVFLEGIVDDFQPMARKNGVELNFYSDKKTGLMWFDGEKLHQVISNLLANAIKFTPKEGRVWIELESGEADDGESAFVQIVVSDTGPGIPSEYREKVFDRFFQVNRPEIDNPDGSGIGLSIVREFIELMDGTIELDSTEETGARFVIGLSLKKAEDYGIREQEIPTTNISETEKTTLIPGEDEDMDCEMVLVVEDNDDLRGYLSSSLSSKYHVLQAANGREGSEMAVKFIPDIIISDWMMPEKTGLEMCSHIKDHPLTCHIPVILLTAKSAVKSRIKGFENQADGYFSKPFSLEEIEGSIASMLANRKAAFNYSKGDTGTKGKSEDFAETDSRGNPDKEFLARLQGILESHLGDEEFAIDDIAHKMLVSRTQLHRKLKAITGESTSAFINNFKLNTSLSLLKAGNYSVKEVAYMVGFSDPRYFSRLFKKKFGQSPGKIF